MAIILSSLSSTGLTCLKIIQTAYKRLGLTAPNAAVTSGDVQVLQMLALLEEEGQEQAERYQWQSLQQEATFTTQAIELQTDLPTGFSYIVNDTIWNRTLRRPVYGPKSQQDWQQAKAMNINGPFNSYRIKDDSIYFYPVPVAGQTCAYEYMSNHWIRTLDGGTSTTFTTDSDTLILDDKLTLLGLLWRWQAAKGLDYSENFAKYEAKINDMMGRDAGKPTLNLNGGNVYDIQPVAVIPRGSWS